MKFYTIFFDDKVVYEGIKDGRYWLGGSIKLLMPMIFNTRKEAMAAMCSVKKRIEAEGIKDLFSKNLEKFNVARFEITKIR